MISMMKRKKLILVGLSIALIGSSSVALAATHSNTHTATVNKVQSKPMEATDQNLPISVESTPASEPVASPETTVATGNRAFSTLETSVTVSALDQFQQDISARTEGYASYFVPSYAPDTSSFIDNQIRCASRGLDDTTGQDILDAKLSYFSPIDNGNGTLTYRFYTGGCQPVFIAR